MHIKPTAKRQKKRLDSRRGGGLTPVARQNYQIGPYLLPPRALVEIVYADAKVLADPILQYQNIRYSPTILTQLDPTVGSTTYPGQAAFTKQYSKYRVVAFKASVEFANVETRPIQCYVLPFELDPGVGQNTNNTFPAAQWLAQKACRHKYIAGAPGNNVGTITTPWITVASFGGSSTKDRAADLYSGVMTGGIPSNNMWVAVGVRNDYAGTNLATGVEARTTLYLRVELFEQVVQTS